jgi:hypothetical protein
LRLEAASLLLPCIISASEPISAVRKHLPGEAVSRFALQIVNGFLASLTIFLGGASLLLGIDSPIYPDGLPELPVLDSNLRFFGGMGVGLGVALLWLIPAIEKHTTLFRVIWLCALAGGIGRIISAVTVGAPPTPILIFTAIEVPGVPLLIYWQTQVAAAQD